MINYLFPSYFCVLRYIQNKLLELLDHQKRQMQDQKCLYQKPFRWHNLSIIPWSIKYNLQLIIMCNSILVFCLKLFYHFHLYYSCLPEIINLDKLNKEIQQLQPTLLPSQKKQIDLFPQIASTQLRQSPSRQILLQMELTLVSFLHLNLNNYFALNYYRNLTNYFPSVFQMEGG